ncbi:hypothetical protein QZH41_016043 [Actinostola sp. cb2023]|nr:hypothetical protein QZH41_016043 [Actinostola sp. cb2023]
MVVVVVVVMMIIIMIVVVVIVVVVVMMMVVVVVVVMMIIIMIVVVVIVVVVVMMMMVVVVVVAMMIIIMIVVVVIVVVVVMMMIVVVVVMMIIIMMVVVVIVVCSVVMMMMVVVVVVVMMIIIMMVVVVVVMMMMVVVVVVVMMIIMMVVVVIVVVVVMMMMIAMVVMMIIIMMVVVVVIVVVVVMMMMNAMVVMMIIIVVVMVVVMVVVVVMMMMMMDLKVPDVSGPHCMVVQYGPGGSLCLTSKMITFTADAGPPVRLEPESVPPTPTVSNTSRLTGRYLVRTLRLNLKDKFDNNAGENLQGKVLIRITSPIDGIDEIPTLANASRHNQIEVSLVKGVAIVQNLYVQENTNGKDGQEYLLNFQAVLGARAVPHPVPPFTLAFLFYNDVRKQQQMAQLTKERDHLFETIRTYRSLFDTTRQLIQEMRVSVHEAAQQEQKLRGELKKQNVTDQHLQSTQSVDSCLTVLVKKRQDISKAPRRQCSLNAGPRGDPDILGKVAHLAQVKDDDVARVLSWHMASDMDCVVTLTTSKAKEVYNESNGQQQVLPLDSIYKQRLPEWNRPLPHIRNGTRNFQAAGNPIYARDKLIFPGEMDNCKIVFGMLLGDTIILDDLDCANKYRHEVVKQTHCPTILTRTGDRIRSNGKFGGLQNRAPLLERMRGAVFSAPVSANYSTLSTQIEQLQAYKQVQLKHQQAKSDLEVQLQQGQTAEMKIKHRECHDAETQLRMIEERLGMTPTQYDMPASPATMLHTELSTPLSRSTIALRRIQGTPSTPIVNGSASHSRTRRPSPLNSEDPKGSKRPRRV